MKHAREDYNAIQDTTAAIQLAELILSMDLITDKGLVARRLAREVLSIGDHGRAPNKLPITTNGTTRLIPADEPVFLIRGQDAVSGDAVRAWADLAEAQGSDPEILRIAREHAAKMDAWPKKKVADLPYQPSPGAQSSPKQHGYAPAYDLVHCPACGFVKTDGGRDWGAAANQWFPSRAHAELYRVNGHVEGLPSKEARAVCRPVAQSQEGEQ